MAWRRSPHHQAARGLGHREDDAENFVKERLQLKGVPVMVEFNSWEWRGQEKIREAFFASM